MSREIPPKAAQFELFDAIPAPVFVKDRKHRWVYLNDSLCRLMGATREDFLGKSDYDFFPKDQADVFWKMDELTFNSNIPIVNEENFQSADGAVHVVLTTKTTYTLPSGEVLLVGTFTELTADREREKQYRHLLRMFRSLERLGNIGGWELDFRSGDLKWTDQTYRIYGLPIGQEISFDAAKSRYGEAGAEEVTRILELAKHSGAPFEIELPLRRFDGSSGWVKATGEVLLEGDEVVSVSGALQDITSDRTAQDEVKSAWKAAEKANEAKGQFLANMSHELRTPLNGILGIAEVLQDDDLTPSQRELINSIAKSGKTLLSIMNDILDMSKIEAGKTRLDPTPINLPDVARLSAELFANAARSKSLDIEVQIDPKLPPLLLLDGLRIQQVLMNLVSNAVKFTPNGGKVRVQVQSLKTQEFDRVLIELSVTDSGIGIPKASLERIFEAFEQGEGGITRRFGGSGLGLTICAGIVQLMGGSLKVESVEGHGTTFSFVIEAPIATSPPTATTDSLESGIAIDLPKLRVLVAEDNAVNQKVIATLLSRLGHEVTVVEDGNEAIEAHRTTEFDVILMDVQMPNLDGAGATEAIRNGDVRSEIPIIAVTAHALVGDRERYLALGMNGYVSKPITKALLVSELGAVLTEKAPEG